MNRLLSLLASVLLGLALATSSALAQVAYPTRPIHFIVPFAAGGTTDVLARIVGDKLQQALGQPVVIENRGGASGNIGADAVAKAPPDGYTLLVGTVGTHAINASLYAKMPFDPIADFAPVAFLAAVPNVMVVSPKAVKATTVQEFIAEAMKAGNFSVASSGIGTSIHLTGELFKQVTGLEMTHVPYRGAGPALNDLIGGQVQVMFDNLPSSIQHVRAGTLRALAVSAPGRVPTLPDVPTLAESGLPGVIGSSWFALFAPRGTPAPIITRLNTEIRNALSAPDVKKRVEDLGGEIRLMSPDELMAYVRQEHDKWAKVVKTAGVKAE